MLAFDGIDTGDSHVSVVSVYGSTGNALRSFARVCEEIASAILTGSKMRNIPSSSWGFSYVDAYILSVSSSTLRDLFDLRARSPPRALATSYAVRTGV